MVKSKYDVDFRTRSVVVVRDTAGEASFQVIGYGLSHRDLCTIDAGPEGRPPTEADLNMGGGAMLERKLRCRGIDTERWRGNIFETAAVVDRWNDRNGHLPVPRKVLPDIERKGRVVSESERLEAEVVSIQTPLDPGKCPSGPSPA